tara:strand:- start:376 stop:771 length:396 start_codon:yes stop_codon:yes gene_type:complete
LLPRTSKASEILKAGESVKEDSVVFTIEEAEKLKSRIFELEKKEKVLDEYKDLCSIKDSKIDIYKINESLYKDQLLTYQSIVDIQDKRLEKQRKIESASQYRNAGFFVLGVSVAIGSILIADKVNDSIEQY